MCIGTVGHQKYALPRRQEIEKKKINKEIFKQRGFGVIWGRPTVIDYFGEISSSDLIRKKLSPCLNKANRSL